MTNESSPATFSPIENEPPLRWQRALHLAPRNGLGVGRRAALFTAIAWLPVVIWAALTHHLWEAPADGESLLQHFGVHARFLMAIPLFILAEAYAHRWLSDMFVQFRRGGIVSGDAEASFDRILRDVVRLRNASMPWIFMLGVVLAWTIIDKPDPRADELEWARESDGSLGFGGWWIAYVARPIFLALLIGWLWRLFMITVAIARIGRLELSLVPTHPDRVGGLGFVEPLPMSMTLVTLALSFVVASRWAHDILYHGMALEAIKIPGAVFVVCWTLLLLLPLLALAPVLLAARRRLLPAYSNLVEKHGRLVQRRWIDNKPVADTPLLEAPEIGPVADTAAIYLAVRGMKPAPIGKRTLLAILVPIAIPFVLVVMLRVPLQDVLLTLLKSIL